MRMMAVRHVLYGLFACAALCVLTACDGDTPASEEPTAIKATPGVKGTATAAATPAGVGSAPTVTVDVSAISTGDARIDSLIAAIESRNIDALIAVWEAQPVICGNAPQPVCPPGTLRGTEIDLFPTMDCEPGWVSERADLRPSIEAALAGSDRSALYSLAKLPGYMGRGPPSGYIDRRETLVIVTTAGVAPSPFAEATTWNAAASGMLKGASPPCEELPAAFIAERAGGYGVADWILSPRATCANGKVRVDVEIWNNSRANREMLGRTLLADGGATGAVEIIRVLTSTDLSGGGTGLTQWHGGLTNRDGVYAGVRVTAEGNRLDNCIIDARDVTRIAAANP